MAVNNYLGVAFISVGLISGYLWMELFDELSRNDVDRRRMAAFFPIAIAFYPGSYTGRMRTMYWMWMGTLVIEVAILTAIVVLNVCR